MESALANEISQDELYDRSECYRLMLEAGADCWTPIDGIPWKHGGQSVFEFAVRNECCVS
jgi:hypothetical protein